MVKPVTFPFELDMYSLCTPELKARLDPQRKLKVLDKQTTSVLFCL